MNKRFWIIGFGFVLLCTLGTAKQKVDMTHVRTRFSRPFVSLSEADQLAKGYKTISISKAEELRKAGSLHPVLIGKDSNLPQAFDLFQTIPNPASSTVHIQYSLAKPTHTTMRIYDLTGRLVQTLVEEEKEAGTYIVPWYGKDATGNRVSSGIYFYHLNAGDFTAIRKLVILR